MAGDRRSRPGSPSPHGSSSTCVRMADFLATQGSPGIDPVRCIIPSYCTVQPDGGRCCGAHSGGVSPEVKAGGIDGVECHHPRAWVGRCEVGATEAGLGGGRQAALGAKRLGGRPSIALSHFSLSTLSGIRLSTASFVTLFLSWGPHGIFTVSCLLLLCPVSVDVQGPPPPVPHSCPASVS